LELSAVQVSILKKVCIPLGRKQEIVLIRNYLYIRVSVWSSETF